MSITESIRCETIDAEILLQTSVGDIADTQAVLFGIPPEHLLFDSRDLRSVRTVLDERAGDAWTAFQVESCER